MRLPVLMYHHIGAVHPKCWRSLTLSPETFTSQIRWLAAHGYTGIHACEWWQSVRSSRTLPARPVLLTFDDAYADLVGHVFPVLRHYRFKATVFVVSGHVGGASQWDRSFGYPALGLMNEAQIRYWSEQGIEFGAHSRTHPDLRDLSTAELDWQLQGSKEDLANMLNRPVTSFAYPFGLYNDRVRKAASLLFDCAFSCHMGLNSSGTELHQLRRTLV